MKKYRNLSFHLASIDGDEWVATFPEIEKILGFPLPDSAYRHNAWWANQSGEGHSQSSAWQSAGWKTAELDLSSKTVKFVYVGDRPPEQRSARPLTIAQAKEGLAAHFGVPEDRIEITIRG